MIRAPMSAVFAATLAATFAAAPSLASTNVIPRETEIQWRAPGYVPDELLVKFKGVVSDADARKAIHGKGASTKRVLTNDGLIEVKLPLGVSVPDVIRAWSRLPGVEYASPNLYAHAFTVPNDSLVQSTRDLAWNLRNADAYDAWDVVTGDPSVVLAIIDSGVAFEDHAIPDYEMPLLDPKTTMYRRSPELPGPFLPGYDFVHDDGHPNDDHGHGTMVATIAAGAANNLVGSAGIAFGVTILPIKVLNEKTEGTMADIVQGIRFAADHGADIANLSLGFASIHELRLLDAAVDSLEHVYKPLKDAISYAQRRGVVVVAAAGNFREDPIFKAFPDLAAPASCPGVLPVSATDFNNDLASYSSYGHGPVFTAPGGDFGDQSGDGLQDGVWVLSIKRRFSAGSPAQPDSFRIDNFVGTSGAAPHVSGAVALLMSLGVRDQASIERILRSTAVRWSLRPNGENPDPTYGFLRIQIGKAVRLAAARGPLGPANQEPTADPQRPAWSVRLDTPNPARDGATLSLRTERRGFARVRVFDVRGALVRTVEEGAVPAGERSVRWDGRNEHGIPVSSGVYFFRIDTEDGVVTRKIAVLR